ncbi:MAG: DNA mismatch repair protein MutS [Flavobacteriales bacterium]|nr:DNA mismatch repair protein MutS [Flavobacteriales bacterium]
MNLIDEQTVCDLEFDLIRLMLHDLCVQPSARLRMVDLQPQRDWRKLRIELLQVEEFKTIRETNASFPAIDFEEMEEEIRLLQLRQSVLSEKSFERLHRSSILVNLMLHSFEPLRSSFLELSKVFENVHITEDITLPIQEVFDAKWIVRDNASSELHEIRMKMVEVRKTIARNFQKILREAVSKGFLADTHESFINNRKVLAVISSHKRKIPGIACGSSQTGNLTYIEPEINVPLNFELEMLADDEREEIRKILQELTQRIRHALPLVKAYQDLLTELDFIQAKTRLAIQLDARLPEITEDQVIDLKAAFHPILLLSNRRNSKKTIPQSIQLDKFARILVISGPNAGGKSIALKTVGLLQLMFQSGLLVPVGEGSRMSFFLSVMSDIGDNQSIENQLSTYSYRLKRMKYFLDHANKRTLVLLDEFGTGSDPDLGGALAEVFFEELYNKKCFGVITTHYGNIKLKADLLRNAINGCMLFDRESLEPTYILSVGQPGSSFTFEVASINGIPMNMIERAKGLLSEQKVAMDNMLSSLQEQKTSLEKQILNASQAAHLASSTIEDFEKRKGKYEEKLQRQNEVIERNNKYLLRGKKLSQFVDSFVLRGKNKELLEDVKAYLAMEKTKIENERKEKTIRKKIQQTDEKKVQVIKIKESIVVGSLVKLENTKQTGSVLEISDQMAIVAFGNFRTKVDISKLEWIK